MPVVHANVLATKEHPSGERIVAHYDVRFDAKGLVAHAGLILPATLAQRLGLPEGNWTRRRSRHACHAARRVEAGVGR